LQRGLQPKKPNNTLWLGTGVHHALQLYYEGKNTLLGAFQEWADGEIERIKKDVGVWDEELDALNETKAQGEMILEHYASWCKDKDNFEPYKMEVMFSLPITNPDTGEQLMVEHPEHGGEVPVVYEGRFDGIVKDDLGHYWILEHKTAKTFSAWDNILDMDEQISSYIWAAQYLFNIPVEGVIYNGLRKKEPTKPTVLKSGKGLSKNKSIDTTYDVYLQAIKDNGFDPADYTDILNHLDNKGNKFFRREFVRRTHEAITSVQEQVFYEAIDMLSAEAFYPNPTRDCSWDCDFKEVCQMVQNREDYEPMLQELYEPREAEEETFDEKVGK